MNRPTPALRSVVAVENTLGAMTHARQHSIPVFLLNQWCRSDDGRLTAFRWVHGKFEMLPRPPTSVGWILHQYSLDRRDGTKDVSIEKEFLGPHVDNPAAVVHQKLLMNGLGSLSGEQFFCWAQFLASLLIRAPRMVAHLKESGKTELVTSLEADPHAYEEIRGDAVEQTLLEWFEAHESWLLETFGTRMLPGLIQRQDLLGYFLGSNTWILRSFGLSKYDLLTCDQPLLHYGSVKDEYLFALPLSPRVLFAVTNNARMEKSLRDASEDFLVKQLNLATVKRADRWVVGSDTSQGSFVRAHLPR